MTDYYCATGFALDIDGDGRGARADYIRTEGQIISVPCGHTAVLPDDGPVIPCGEEGAVRDAGRAYSSQHRVRSYLPRAQIGKC
jgi:hypothetical protein